MRAEEPFSLGPRLGLCASFVRPGCRLADIGADHAHLSVWLACRGAVRSAIAADVREGPLGAARRTIARCGVESLVTARLSDGLRAIRPEEADDIVIAGMGGELIARIVGEAPWLCTPERHLILQPMTSAEDLRRFLLRAGFAVSREEAVCEDERVYSAMLVWFDPETAALQAADPVFPYRGLVTGAGEAGCAYLLRRAASLEKRVNGLRRSGRPGEARPLDEIRLRLLQEAKRGTGGNE